MMLRRDFLSRSGAALAACGMGSQILSSVAAAAVPGGQPSAAEPRQLRRNRIGVSTYSFWQFKKAELRSIETCLDHAARLGFDGVEILQVQMTDDSNAYLQRLKQQAFSLGLDLMGFSTHQSFVSPDADFRQEQIDHTLMTIEQAYRLGIPTLRVNTGRWGTISSFDELMANRGIEPRLEGYTDDDGFRWVIDSMEKLLPKAAECGVTLGLENHWGLGRTAEGVLRVVQAINSPWLQVTLDTGNFLEDDRYESMSRLAPRAILLQAKTYYGGGTWYTLDLDYARIARIMKDAGYQGYVSLEFEGNDDPLVAIPRSLAMLREHF